MDGDLIQGALQSLLQNRQQLGQRQQQAQQQHIQSMQTPLPQTSPIQSMVSDYLQKYAQNPGMAWSAMASAAGGANERSRKIDEDYLLRQQAADAQEAKYAGDALKEEALFGTKLSMGLRGGKGAGVTVKMDKDGNMVVYDPLTQESKVVHSSQRGEYQRIWSKAYEKAVQEDLENPEGYAANVAANVLSGSPSFNPQRENIPGKSKVTPPGPPPSDLEVQAITVPKGTPTQAEGLIVQQFQKALQLAQNPETRAQGVAQLEALKQLYPQQEAAPGAIKEPGAPETMQYRDVRTKESQKTYGGEEGKKLFQERQDLDTLYATNSKLMNQLDMLEKVYSNPNIPEGQLAEYEQNIRSGLKTLGVEVAPETGITDFAKALGTSLALTQKNADGKNLLPGAMSNYEDQLLQKMAPTLTLTNEGRMALIKFMKQVSQSNLRMSSEATKMAGENKDMLPPSWYKRKERIMLEEMARMKAMSNQLIQQYGGGKQ